MKQAMLGLWLLLGCSDVALEPSSQVRGVRLLATRADSPYAAPGETVTLEALAVDGRQSASEPLRLSWLAAPCINPPGDAYYGCFEAFGERFRPSAVIEQGLESGNRFEFALPEEIIDTHPNSSETPYGLAVVFSIACAGRVIYLPVRAGAGPDAVPFACLDRAGQRLGANEFVFGYSLVYAFIERQNRNPVIDGIRFGGEPVDLVAGLSIEHCGKASIDDCAATKLDLLVPDESQELDPSNTTAAGGPLREFLYAQYFSTAGKFANDTLTLFDAREGRLTHTGNDFRAPQAPGEYWLWAVLRDNRGGVAWQTIALHVH